MPGQLVQHGGTLGRVDGDDRRGPLAEDEVVQRRQVDDFFDDLLRTQPVLVEHRQYGCEGRQRHALDLVGLLSVNDIRRQLLPLHVPIAVDVDLSKELCEVGNELKLLRTQLRELPPDRRRTVGDAATAAAAAAAAAATAPTATATVTANATATAFVVVVVVVVVRVVVHVVESTAHVAHVLLHHSDKLVDVELVAELGERLLERDQIVLIQAHHQLEREELMLVHAIIATRAAGARRLARARLVVLILALFLRRQGERRGIL